MFAIANRQRHQAVVAEPDIREPAFAIDAHDEPEMIERRCPIRRARSIRCTRCSRRRTPPREAVRRSSR